MNEYIQPRLGAESFSCPHCNTVAHQDWYSLFLKPENAAEVRVLTPEAIRQGEAQRDSIKEIDQFIERLKKRLSLPTSIKNILTP